MYFSIFSRHLPQCSWIDKILLVRGDSSYFVCNCFEALQCKIIHYFFKRSWGVNSWVNSGWRTKFTSIIPPRKTMIPQNLLCEYRFGVGALWLFLTWMYPAVGKNCEYAIKKYNIIYTRSMYSRYFQRIIKIYSPSVK